MATIFELFPGERWDALRGKINQNFVNLNTEGGGGAVSDDPYGPTWDGDTETAASKNALYDKIETLAGGHDPVTLGTANGLTLSVQELGLNVATTISAGAMSLDDKVKLDGIECDATADQTGAEIKVLYEAEANTNAFTDTEKTKLSGIEDNATADQSDAEIKTAYENNADTNAYTDAEKTKLTGIETGATADQTGAEIKVAYEGEANTNAYTDAEKTKLAGIEEGATTDQTALEIKTAYESNSDTNAYTDSEKSAVGALGTISTKNFLQLTQAAYDALGSYDSNTLYFISG